MFSVSLIWSLSKLVISGFNGAGSRLGLIFGWDFVVLVPFVTVLHSHEVIWFGLGIINKPLYWYVQSLKTVEHSMGWMCFYFRIAQIKYAAVELTCVWCFLRTTIHISLSISHYRPSKEKKKSQQGKTEAIVDECDPHVCRACMMVLEKSKLNGKRTVHKMLSLISEILSLISGTMPRQNSW